MAGGVTEPYERVLAAVSSEHATALVTADRDVTFGRAATATVRVGFAPVYDDVVPRVAGRVFAAGDRVVVENLHDTLAFDLKVGCRPLVTVAPGDWHSPLERTFDIIVAGGITAYELTVTVNVDHNRTQRLAAGDPDADPPTGASPELTERQRRILDAYVEPLAGGAPVATHAQVAERLGISRSTVRVECERIWSALFLAGVPMRDLGDARDEIVDAWGRHRF